VKSPSDPASDLPAVVFARGSAPGPSQARLPLLPTKKKATALAQVIVDQIVSLGLQAGDRLPPESEMVELYGVGRGTLRETLRLLEHQGVVVIRPGPGGGPIVAPLSGRPMGANVALFLQRAGGTFRSVLDVRRTVEPEIAALAATKQDPEVLRALRNSIDAHHAELDGAARFVSAAANFHDLVAKSTGNPGFEAILLALHRITEPFAQRLRYDEARRKQLLRSHDRVVRAIERGDAPGARRAMIADLDEFVHHVEATAPSLLDELITWDLVES
jgi:DNA-binding FadR family transcriptional regulator